MTEVPIAALFFDIGGVLLTNGWDRKSRKKAAEFFGLDYEEMDERHHLTFDTYEEGKLTLDEYLNRLVFYQDRPFTREAFREFMYAQSEPDLDMLNLVRKIKERYPIKIGTISNEGRELTVYRINTFGLTTFIDFFISSCFVHYRKPDADIFRIALDVAQVLPEQSIYIEDRQLFVDEALRLGFIGIRHQGFEQTRAALEQAGLSVR